MKAVKLLLLLLLLLLLATDGVPLTSPMPGSPGNVSRRDWRLQQVILGATHFFNSQSNDAFLFQPSAIHRAQRQVVKGMRFLVDFDISRTICRKRDTNSLTPCSFQPPGCLQQTLQCHADVWLILWKNQTRTLELHCGP